MRSPKHPTERRKVILFRFWSILKMLKLESEIEKSQCFYQCRRMSGETTTYFIHDIKWWTQMPRAQSSMLWVAPCHSDKRINHSTKIASELSNLSAAATFGVTSGTYISLAASSILFYLLCFSTSLQCRQFCSTPFSNFWKDLIARFLHACYLIFQTIKTVSAFQ